MHRVTPDHYNLYDEREELVGSLHQLPEGGTHSGWYGQHVKTRHVTGTHPERHLAARNLLDHHARVREDLGMQG